MQPDEPGCKQAAQTVRRVSLRHSKALLEPFDASLTVTGYGPNTEPDGLARATFITVLTEETAECKDAEGSAVLVQYCIFILLNTITVRAATRAHRGPVCLFGGSMNDPWSRLQLVLFYDT